MKKGLPRNGYNYKEKSSYKEYLLKNKEQVTDSGWKIDKQGNIKRDFVWSD